MRRLAFVLLLFFCALLPAIIHATESQAAVLPECTIETSQFEAFPGEPVFFKGTASDNVRVSKVELIINSSPWRPASLFPNENKWTYILIAPQKGGDYEVKARAFDNDENIRACSPQRITVRVNEIPVFESATATPQAQIIQIAVEENETQLEGLQGAAGQTALQPQQNASENTLAELEAAMQPSPAPLPSPDSEDPTPKPTPYFKKQPAVSGDENASAITQSQALARQLMELILKILAQSLL